MIKSRSLFVLRSIEEEEISRLHFFMIVSFFNAFVKQFASQGEFAIITAGYY